MRVRRRVAARGGGRAVGERVARDARAAARTDGLQSRRARVSERAIGPRAGEVEDVDSSFAASRRDEATADVKDIFRVGQS